MARKKKTSPPWAVCRELLLPARRRPKHGYYLADIRFGEARSRRHAPRDRAERLVGLQFELAAHSAHVPTIGWDLEW